MRRRTDRSEMSPSRWAISLKSMSRSSWEDKGEFIGPYRCSLLALELLELLFVGNALLIHALGQLAISLKDLGSQAALVLVDKLHQKLPFLGVDFVDLRHDSTRNRHDRFRGKERLPLNLIVKRQDWDVVASRGIHGIKHSFDTEIDEVVRSLLQELRLFQDAVDEIDPQDEGNAFPGLFLGFGLHTERLMRNANRIKHKDVHRTSHSNTRLKRTAHSSFLSASGKGPAYQ